MARPSVLPVILVALAGALGACVGDAPPRELPGAANLPYRGTKTIAPFPKVDFTLPDAQGRPYDFRTETDGRIALLFFGYTYCPDICPIHMATLASALDDLDADARSMIDVVFFSVDPERDTPERLRTWLSAFDSTFVGVRGSAEEVAEALAFYRYPPPERSTSDGPVYTVGHPSLIYAYTPDGLSHVMYGPETPRAVWVHDLSLMAGYPWTERTDPPAPATASPLGAAGDVAVLDAFAPEPPAGSAAALYLTLVNEGSAPDTLTGVSTPAAARGSLHVMVRDGGMARMDARPWLVVPPGDTLRLAPGGAHGMFEEVAGGGLVAGSSVDVTLTFARGGTVTVPARVVRYDELVGA